MFAFDHTFHNMSTQNHDLQVNLYFFEKKKDLFIDWISIQLQDLSTHKNKRYQKARYNVAK